MLKIFKHKNFLIFILGVLFITVTIFVGQRDKPKITRSEIYTKDSIFQPVYTSLHSSDSDLKYIISGLEGITTKKEDILYSKEFKQIKSWISGSQSYEYWSLENINLDSRFPLFRVVDDIFEDSVGTLFLYNKEKKTYKQYEVADFIKTSNYGKVHSNYKYKYGKYIGIPNADYKSEDTIKVDYLSSGRVYVTYKTTYWLNNEKELEDFVKSSPRKEK